MLLGSPQVPVGHLGLLEIRLLRRRSEEGIQYETTFDRKPGKDFRESLYNILAVALKRLDFLVQPFLPVRRFACSVDAPSQFLFDEGKIATLC